MKRHAYKIRMAVAVIFFVLALLALTVKFYPVNLFDIQFTAVLSKVVHEYSVPAVIILSVLLLATILFGRLYCSTICPFGILQEISALIFRRDNEPQKNMPYKYFIAAICWGGFIGGTALFIRHADPYAVFGAALSGSILGIIILLCTLSLVFFRNRFFCANICPVGAVLGLISKVSVNKIYMGKDCLACGMCERNCPTGCIDATEETVDNETCVKCLKCLEVCPKEAMQYGIKPKAEEPEKFSIKRRELILSASVLVVLGGAIKAGAEIVKRLGSKIKAVLPPGAGNREKFANTCINCNLCVKNCPNGVIAKADKNCNVVHLDYSKGRHICQVDCNRCSEVCPAGALKKITKEEKQRTQIAYAVIDEKICRTCGICSHDCPAGAIDYEDAKVPKINTEKCIGCGRCALTCPFDVISMVGVDEQKMV